MLYSGGPKATYTNCPGDLRPLDDGSVRAHRGLCLQVPSTTPLVEQAYLQLEERNTAWARQTARDLPYLSCADVLAANPSAESGIYNLDLRSVGGELTAVYCEMTQNGGGWTLVYRGEATTPAMYGPARLDSFWGLGANQLDQLNHDSPVLPLWKCTGDHSANSGGATTNRSFTPRLAPLAGCSQTLKLGRDRVRRMVRARVVGTPVTASTLMSHDATRMCDDSVSTAGCGERCKLDLCFTGECVAVQWSPKPGYDAQG